MQGSGIVVSFTCILWGNKIDWPHVGSELIIEKYSAEGSRQYDLCGLSSAPLPGVAQW